ncbi:MAG: hypothetical protein V3V88_03630 [Dehalococcoidia bacterium]
MFKKLREFFERAWKYIQALWEKHDDQLEEMVEALLPMVIDVAFRPDLSGEDKKKAIVDMVVDNAEATAGAIATSMLNEAVEIAANKYNIQIGKLTKDRMDNALDAAVKAGRDYADKKLHLEGDEAEKAGLRVSESLSNADLD